jgi:hypothetical protein
METSEPKLPDIQIPEVKPPEPRFPDNPIVGKMIEALEVKKLEPTKAHWWDRIWAWANGKKLFGGAGLMIIGGVMQFIPGIQAAGWAMIGKGTFTVGSIIAGTGLIHKILKQSNNGIFGNKEIIELIIGILELIVKLITKLKKK